MEQNEVRKITPFNDVYYVGCFYLVFFTAIRYLNGSIFSYIVNESFIYKLEQTLKGLSLIIENRQTLSLPEITENNHIYVEDRFDYCIDIIDIIKDSLLNGCVVVVAVDGFHFKHRYHDLFYLKKHHYQSILVYDFDSEREIFKIIEVNGFEWNTEKCCYKHEISFQDLVICHEGIINHVQDGMPTLLKLSKSNSNKIITDDPHFYKSTLINNLKAHKDDIYKGLKNICTLLDNIEQFDISKTTCFNNKIASLSNQYKINKILGVEDKNISFMNEILEKWIIIESLVYKYEVMGVQEKKNFSSTLYQLYESENKLYDSLFSSFDKNY